MANLPSVARKITVEETDFRSPVSESTEQKIGSSINFILDYFTLIPGLILPYGGLETNLDPASFLPCDGRRVLKATYANLYAAIGDLWGPVGVLDFQIPDLRGRFVRGQSTTIAGASGNDPDETFRAPLGTGTYSQPGSYQSDAVGTHDHKYGATGSGGSLSGAFLTGAGTFTDWVFPTSPNTGGRPDTRPRNVYCLWIIKT